MSAADLLMSPAETFWQDSSTAVLATAHLQAHHHGPFRGQTDLDVGIAFTEANQRGLCTDAWKPSRERRSLYEQRCKATAC
jgi:hypothetical protein